MSTEAPALLPEDLWEVLAPRLSSARREKMLGVAAQRTAHLCLVLQDVHDPHNISACLRSAEAFGVQQVHVVKTRPSFKPSTAAKGVGQWLSLEKHATIAACVERLRQGGFKIAAGLPAQAGVLALEEVTVAQPLALVFGNEHEGISAEWQQHCDLFFTIPMVGMVESLNISVSAAITLQQLSTRARQSLAPEQYYLDAKAQQQLLGRWLSQQVRGWPAEYARRAHS